MINHSLMSNTYTKNSLKDGRWISLYLFLFALAVRGWYYFGFMDNPNFDYVNPAFDQTNFDNAAISFANGNILATFGGSDSYAPLYNYFIGIIYLVFGRNFFAVWAIQFLIGAVASVLMFKVTIRFFNKRVAIICSLFYAMYGPNIFYEGNLIRASLTEFFAIALFYCLLRYKEKLNLRNPVLCGTALSLLIQCRPNTIVVLPFVIFFVAAVILKGLTVKAKVKHIVLLSAIMIIVGTPLMIRTVIVHKRFVLYDTSGSMTLVAGNLPEYKGVGWDNNVYLAEAIKTSREIGEGYTDIITFIFKKFVASPIDYFKLYGRKLYWFFNNYEYPSNVNYYLSSEFSPVLKNPSGSFSLLVALAVAGIFLTRKSYKNNLLIYLFLTALVLSVVIVYPVSRFRMPVVPFFMMFASYTIDYIYNSARKKKVLFSFLCIVAVAALVYILKVPGGDFYKIRPLDYNNMGIAYGQNTRKLDLDKSAAYLLKAHNQTCLINKKRIEGFSKNKDNGAAKDQFLVQTIPLQSLSDTYYLLAKAAFDKKDYDLAISYCKKSIKVDFGNVKVHMVLCLSYFFNQNYLKTIDTAKTLICLDAQNGEAFYLLAMAYRNTGLSNNAAVFYSMKALHINSDIFKEKYLNGEEIKKTIETEASGIEQNVSENRQKIEKLLNISLKVIESGEYNKAISYCNEIIDIDFSNFDAHNCLAFCYGTQGRNEESISEYINLLTIEPDISKVHLNIYNLYTTLGNAPLKAQYHLEKSLEIDPYQGNVEVLRMNLESLKYWKNVREITFN